MGAFWKVGQWERENAVAGYVKNLRDYANAYKKDADSKETANLLSSFVAANDEVLLDDAAALRQAIDNGNDYAVTLDNIAKKKQEAIKQNSGFATSIKSLGNVMKSVGASLLSGALYAGINWVIGAVWDYAEHQINAAKYAKEALQEASAEWDELIEKQQSAGDLVTKYESDYDRLSKGVNMVTGENVSLSDDEYELFKQINSELANSALTSAEGITVAYDAQGQAIVRLSGQMDSLSDAYKQLEQQTRSEIRQELPEVLKQMKTALIDNKWWQDHNGPIERLNSAQQALDLANSSQNLASDMRFWADAGEAHRNLRFGIGYDSTDAMVKAIEEGTDIRPAILAYMRKQEAEIELALSPAKSAMKMLFTSDMSDDVPSALSGLVTQYIEQLSADYFLDKSDNDIAVEATRLANMASTAVVQQAFEGLHDVQADFAKGDINYGQYKEESEKRLAEFMTEAWPEELQTLLNEAYGLDESSAHNRAVKRLEDVIVDSSEEWIKSLTSDQLNFALSLDNTRKISQADFTRRYDAYRQSEQYSSKAVVDSYAKTSEAQAVMDEVIKAQGYSASVTAEQYQQLVEAGDEYAACVKNVNGYMQLDIEAARELAKAKNEEAKATVDAGKAYKLQQYGDNLKNLRYLRELLEDKQGLDAKEIEVVEDKIKALEAEQDVIKSDIDAYNRLGSEIAYATSSYKKWLDAQDAPEAGDAYDNMLVAMGQLQEGLDSGKIGTVKFKAAAELLVPEGADVKAYMQTLGKYLTENADGLGKFVDDMFAKGFLSKDSSGRYSFMQGVTVEDIAKGLGLTGELTQYMLQALQDYGWDVDILNSEFSSDEALRRQEAAVENLKLKEEELARLRKESADNAEAIAKAEQDVVNAQAELEAADAALVQVTEEELTAVERLEADLERLQTLYDSLGALELGGKVDEQFAADIAMVQDVLSKILDRPEGYTVSISTDAEKAAALSQITELKSAIEAIDSLADNGVISYDVAAELTGTLTDDLTALEAKVGEYESNQKQLKVTAMLNDQATAELEAIEEGSYHAEMGVSLNKDDVEAIEQQLSDLEERHRILREAQFDNPYENSPADYDPNKANLPEYVPHAWQGGDSPADKPTTEVVIEPVLPEEPPVLSVEADTSAAESAIDQVVAYGNAKTATLQYKAMYVGPGYAEGTKNARAEDAMVGEQGVETIVSNGHYYTVGHNGPEIVHLEAGDQVLTNAETKRLFKGTPRKAGRAYAAGRPFVSTTAVGGGANLLDKEDVSTVQQAVLGAAMAGISKSLEVAGGGIAPSSKTTSSSSSGTNYNKILEQFEKLHDWIVRALEVAEKRTQSLIDSVKDFVGYMAQNKQVDKALQSTRKEIELNQQAYVRYMQQAADVQDKLDLTDDIVKKIQEGTIDIEEFDETTKKKIAEYQEWYEKAEATLDTIEELKDQERELQLQRMDNILDDYNNRMDQLDDESARVQREIELQKAIGAEVQENSYNKLIEGERKQVATLQRERAALEAEFNALVASGVLQVGSEDWHKYRNELEGIDEAIHDATVSMTEFADEIYNLRLDKLQAVANTLQNIQANTEGIMSLHDAQGTKNVQEYYDTLIANGHDQIANLADQNSLIREQMESLEPGSEKYQELLESLRANEQTINDIKVSQEQWNDAIADLSIADLEEQREALEKTNEQYKRQLEYEEALEALAKAKNQRTKLLYIEGQGFQYVADQDAIEEAQKRVDDLEHQSKIDAIDDQIEAIEDAKANDNVWSYDGATLLKQNGITSDVVAEAIQEMLGAALLPDNYTQTKQFETLNTPAGSAGVPSISIGDIHLSGVDNVETLAKDIVQNLPNAILQELHKN